MHFGTYPLLPDNVIFWLWISSPLAYFEPPYARLHLADRTCGVSPVHTGTQGPDLFCCLAALSLALLALQLLQDPFFGSFFSTKALASSCSVHSPPVTNIVFARDVFDSWTLGSLGSGGLHGYYVRPLSSRPLDLSWAAPDSQLHGTPGTPVWFHQKFPNIWRPTVDLTFGLVR